MAASGQTATIRYEGSFKSVGGRWEVFDSSSWDDGEPETFRIGANEVIPGLEEAVRGMKVGETKEVVIPPEKGFGPHDENLVQEVSRSVIPEGFSATPGFFVSLPWEDGVNRPAMCKSASESGIVFDFNHPFAGCTLKYRIELVGLS